MNPYFFYSMMKSSSPRLLALAIILCVATLGSAQANAIPEKSADSESTAPKPYKVLTAGKRITVQSKTEINKILVWTSTGHRFVEENNVKSSSYSFTVTTNEKFFYIMLELKNGKRYTEKIGVQAD